MHGKVSAKDLLTCVINILSVISQHLLKFLKCILTVKFPMKKKNYKEIQITL